MALSITLVNAKYQDYKIVSNGKTFLMTKHPTTGDVLVRRGNVSVWGKDLPEAFNGCVKAWNASEKTFPWWWRE